jgi:hypothetical protein
MVHRFGSLAGRRNVTRFVQVSVERGWPCRARLDYSILGSAGAALTCFAPGDDVDSRRRSTYALIELTVIFRDFPSLKLCSWPKFISS